MNSKCLKASSLAAPTKMIAHGLGISPRTVEVHRAHMLERLRTRTIAEAIRLAVMAGLRSAVR